jgi:hypothetical protein
MRVYTKSNIRLTINGDGIATFACQVCSPAAIFAGCVGIGTTTPKGRLHLTGIYDGAQNSLNLENNWPNTHSTSLINFWAYYNSTDPMAVIEAGQDVSATNAGVIKFKTMAGGTAPVTRMSIAPTGNTIFNCNGTYCSNFGYNFLTACNGSILSGTHTMGNMGAGTTCATPLLV